MDRRSTRRCNVCARRNRSALAAVRAIGLSGQMHGAVLLDARDTVLRPAILWNDGRSDAAMRGSSRRRCRACTPSPATSRCRASRHPSCCGCASTSPICSRERPRAAAQGLAALAAHRRIRQRDVRCLGHAVARRRGAPLVRRVARRLRPRRAATCRDWSKAARSSGQLRPALAGRWGLRPGHRSGRRRRRQRGQRGRHRCGAPGRGLRLARHVGRDLRGQRPLPPRPACGRARVLPCAAWALALHVGDAVGGQRLALGARAARRSERSRAARPAWPG